MTYTVYIIYSTYLDRYYVGYTSQNIVIRLQKHNAKHKGFTGKKPDWQIKYTETYPNKKTAMQKEAQIKAWKSRKMIEQLINQ